MNEDLREYKRQIPKGNAYAALGQQYKRVGKILDISQGGLAFAYVSNNEEEIHRSHVSIFSVGDVFHLHNLPCEVVYDVPVSRQDIRIESFRQHLIKRCGVQFMPHEEDNTQLMLFLKTRTKEASL